MARTVNVALDNAEFDRKPEGVTWKQVIERGLTEIEADAEAERGNE